MEIITPIQQIILARFKVARLFLSLFHLEAKLAILSIYPLLLVFSISFALLIVGWLLIMMLIILLSLNQFNSAIPGTVIAILLNWILLAFFYRKLILNVEKLSFQKTRKYFLKIKENQDGKIKK